jgi:uncharacterized protein YdiU (UPF0061 family)
MRAKLGIDGEEPSDAALVDDLLAILQAGRVDHTSFFRALSASLRGDGARLRALVDDAELDAWTERWRTRLGGDAGAAADRMDRVNPVYIARNHLVEEALAAATAGDLAPFEELVGAVTAPFDERPGLERYAEPAPGDDLYVTYCGT